MLAYGTPVQWRSVRTSDIKSFSPFILLLLFFVCLCLLFLSVFLFFVFCFCFFPLLPHSRRWRRPPGGWGAGGRRRFSGRGRGRGRGESHSRIRVGTAASMSVRRRAVMQQRCVRHVSSRVDWLLCGFGLTSRRRCFASPRLCCQGRLYASQPSQFAIESDTLNHHCNNNNNNRSCTVTSSVAPDPSSRRDGSNHSAPALGNEEGKISTLLRAWDLQQVLFGLRDFQTGVVTYVEVEERLRGMRLMDEWMIQKLFFESGWVRQLQENPETAPQYHAVVGEQKILRYMLHRFISDETMWRDDLGALLELIFISVGQSTCCPLDCTSCHTASHPCPTSVDNSACGHEDDYNTCVFSVRIPDSLFKEPEKMNFYSYGLQNVLWEFLQEDASSFEDTSALWRVFVASYRNLLSLPSPQRPPFSRYESHPGILGAEFVGAMHSKQTESPREKADEVALGDTPQEPVESNLSNDGQEEASTDGADDKVMMMNDESGNSYLRDRFYMSVIEPGEVAFYTGDARPSGVLSIAGNEQTPQRHPDVFPASWRGEREILNPGNGELEDIHLNHLWGIFQTMKLEDSIDMYRAVRHGNLEKLKWEVFMDVLARKGLLMLFFARDEVRALTPPHLTYRRLSRLHQELKVIASWASTRGHGVPPPSLPPFEDLTLSSRLSFSCFAQMHAPAQRHLYGFATPSLSPAHLYSRYCEGYSQSLVQTNAHSQDAKKEDAGKTILCETPTMLEKRQFPRFECLGELQQMAFYYSFHDEVPHSSPQPNIDDSCSSGVGYNVSINQKYRTELTESELSDEPTVAIRKRGRPRRTALTESDASDEPTVAIRKRGRPRRTVLTESDASDEPTVAIRHRGRPRRTVLTESDASDEPTVAIGKRGRPRRTVLST
ncbi:hypothetical protein MOQ_000611 [Trypanosoma cruzi marinkellei]|uniref:Uncharacterized protein n=1 Tax=Trypanosoma cruzi marinkellei TaxID=85056 RepID=K2NIG9_TRYCR|nr:hypothetical protein MOQ_000611 [Trypanosoma cruzi marinkellei]